jgi:hypothetical protein
VARAPLLAPAAALLAGGCAGDAGTVRNVAVTRDSAGVVIVESTGPAWLSGEEWRLSPEPVVEIGMVEGPEEYLLFRAGSALKLADGRLLVVNGGTSEIRIYDASGTFVRAFGGRGGGPGEFGSGPSIQRLGADSLLAFDGAGQRVSVFDTAGTFARSYRLEWDPSFRYTSVLILAGPLGDGTLLVRQNPNVPLSSAGWGRRPLPFLRYGPDGRMMSRVVELEGDEYRVADADIRLRDGRTSHTRGGFPFPFGREAVWTVHDAHLYYGSNNSFKIAVYDREGGLVRLIRALVPPDSVTESDLADVREAWAADEFRSAWGMRDDPFGSAPIPTTKPPLTRIAIDAAGNVWAGRSESRWSIETDTLPQRWTVFAADGAMLGDIVTPARFRVRDIGGDYVLGVWRDELDVERVRVYALIKPGFDGR